ncbi:MAG: hypothetical protein SGCHY_000163 [Lobulomycetales sp.]
MTIVALPPHCRDTLFKHLFLLRRDEKKYVKSALAQTVLWQAESLPPTNRRKRSRAVFESIFAALYRLKEESAQEERGQAIEDALDRLGIYNDPETWVLDTLQILLDISDLRPPPDNKDLAFQFLRQSALFPSAQSRETEYSFKSYGNLFGALRHPSRDISDRASFSDVELSLPLLALNKAPSIADSLIEAESLMSSNPFKKDNSVLSISRSGVDSGYESHDEEWINISQLDFDSIRRPLYSWEGLSGGGEKDARRKFLTFESLEDFDNVYKSHFTNSFDQGKYDSHADSKIIADHVYKMLYGAESGTFQWSPTEKRCELEGRGSWSFRIRDHIKNRARFSSCGIVSFDTVLSDLMITGTKFRRLQSLFDDIEREPRVEIMSTQSSYEETKCGILAIADLVSRITRNLDLFARLCCCDQDGAFPNSLPTKTNLLNHIFDTVIHVSRAGYDQECVDMLMDTLQASCKPFTSMISTYLRTGIVSDAFNEFLCLSEPDSDKADYLNGVELSPDLPKFLSRSTCKNIMLAGQELAMFPASHKIFSILKPVDLDFVKPLEWETMWNAGYAAFRQMLVSKREQEKRETDKRIMEERLDREARLLAIRSRKRKEYSMDEVRKKKWRRQVEDFLAARDHFLLEQERLEREVLQQRQALELQKEKELRALEAEARADIVASYRSKIQLLKRQEEKFSWRRRRFDLAERRLKYMNDESEQFEETNDLRTNLPKESSTKSSKLGSSPKFRRKEGVMSSDIFVDSVNDFQPKLAVETKESDAVTTSDYAAESAVSQEVHSHVMNLINSVPFLEKKKVEFTYDLASLSADVIGISLVV